MNCRSAQKIRDVEPANIAKGSLELQRGPTYLGRGLSRDRRPRSGRDQDPEGPLCSARFFAFDPSRPTALRRSARCVDAAARAHDAEKLGGLQVLFSSPG